MTSTVPSTPTPRKGKKGFFGTLFGALDASKVEGTSDPSRGNPLEIDFGESVRSGWLLKLSVGRNRKFQKRYAILRDGAMYYYHNKPKSEHEPTRKFIQLEGYVPMVEGRVNGQCVLFKLVHVAKPAHHFATESEAILSEWVKALHMEMFREVLVVHNSPVTLKPMHTQLLEQLADIQDTSSWEYDPAFENSLRARREARRTAQQVAEEEESERRNAQLQVLLATKEILHKDLAAAKTEESKKVIERQLENVRESLQNIIDGKETDQAPEPSLNFARPSESIPRPSISTHRNSEYSAPTPRNSEFSSPFPHRNSEFSLPRNSELYGSSLPRKDSEYLFTAPTPRNSELTPTTPPDKRDGEGAGMSAFQLRKLAEREKAAKEKEDRNKQEREEIERAGKEKERIEQDERNREKAKEQEKLLAIEKEKTRIEEERLKVVREKAERDNLVREKQEKDKQEKERQERVKQQEKDKQEKDKQEKDKQEKDKQEREKQVKLEQERKQEANRVKEQNEREKKTNTEVERRSPPSPPQPGRPKAVSRGPVNSIPADSKVGKLPIQEYPPLAPGTKLTGMPAMLNWAQRATRGFPGVNVANLGKSWQNGLAFAALCANWRPDVMDYWSLDPNDALGNLQKAFKAAEKMGVSMLLDAEDVVDVQDPKSLYTQLTMFHRTLNHQDPAPRPWEAGGGARAEQEVRVIPKEVKNLISLVQSFERRLQELNWRTVEQGDGESLFTDLKAAFPKIQHWKVDYPDELSATIHLYNRLNKEIPAKVNSCLAEIQSKRGGGGTNFSICGSCGKALGGHTVEALNMFFHADCFKCHSCGKALVKTCINVKDKPHCDACGRGALARGAR